MPNPDQRATFAALADTLIPGTETMPSASAAGVADALLDQVLGFRPDLVESFIGALDSCEGQPPEAALDALIADDPDQFEALSVLAAGAYFLSPAVQTAMPYDAAPRPARDDLDDYVDLLERVVDRGFTIR